jgi:lysophospholipase L1-like esterase
MSSRPLKAVALIALLALVFAGTTSAAPTVFPQPGAHLAIAGDSITEQKLYSRFIEDYLQMCTPEVQVYAAQFGWGGESAPGFAGRMDNDMKLFGPNVVTTCYGMNDGSYRPFDEGIGKTYENAMRDIVSRLTKAGVTVVVGSPGAVDTKYFGGPERANMYNDNLAHLRDIAKKIADEFHQPFANVHDPMIAAMAKGKAALGEDYDVCGRDGVHPGPNGQLVMAYAFLKAMGCEGNIGTITVDMAGQATASEGHKVLKSEPGKVDLESSRYSFCFFGDEKSSGGTRSILPFCPFNEELNRFMLVVKGLKGEKAEVTWGTAKQTFTRAELEQGVNLTAAFPENPFAAAFQKVDAAVAAKQNFETPMIKSFITFIPAMTRFLEGDEATVSAVESGRQKAWAKQKKMADDVRAAFAPVTHAISVAAVQ